MTKREDSKVRIALPSKGRISKPAIDLLNNAGIFMQETGTRKLFSRTNHPNIDVMFTRAADIPEFVADGAADVGITGLDLILEKNRDVIILDDLKFGEAKLVLASPENSKIKSKKDLKNGLTVATEFPKLTKEYFDKLGIDVKIVEVSGSTEVTPLIGVADLIVDLTSTGTTLRMNRLKVIDTILESSVRLIANKESYKEKNKTIEEIRTALKGVVEAKNKKLIMLNIEEEKVEEVKKIVPGMTGPTVSKVLHNNMVAVHAVVDEDEVFRVVNELKRIGARDILIVPIERILD